MPHPHPTKIELINEICKIAPVYVTRRGELHYKTRDELILKLKRIKRKLGIVE